MHFFNTLSATRVLNSFEELCITLAAAGNSFARELNPHGGAYIYVDIYTPIHVYIYIHIYAHTHTHTYIYTYVYKGDALILTRLVGWA